MKRVLLSFLLLLTAANCIYSLTLQVPASYPTIQSAISDAVDGDTIVVAPGTYVENINISIKDIHLISSGGADVTTIIPAVSTDYVINMTNSLFPGHHPHQTIRGFTFTGHTSGVSRNLIYIWGASPEITDNIFRDNTNPANNIQAISSEAKIHHNLFYNNNGTYGVFLNTGFNAKVYSNTFYNTAGGVYSINQSYVKHNIFMNFTGTALAVFGPDVDYNDFYRESSTSPMYPGANSLYLDPQFVDASSGNFHLKNSSPMINAGDPDPSYRDIDNTVIDIGRFTTADSLLPLGNNLRFTPIKDTNMVTSLNPDFIWSYWDTAATTQQAVQLQISNDSDWTTAEIWNSGIVNTSDTIMAYSGSNITDRQLYYLRIRVDNGSGFGAWKDTTFSTNTGPQTFTVPTEYSTIQNALPICFDDDSVKVLPGSYLENVEIINKRVNLFSSGGPDITTITAAISFEPVISIDSIPGDGRTSIEGFTISDGSIGIHAENGSIKISNNIIENNTNSIASKTAGIYNRFSTNSLIENNIIRSNQTSFFGGGLYVDRSFGDTVRYNIMHDNIGDPEIRIVDSDNIIFYNNTVDVGIGDGYYGATDGSSVLTNNIFINASGNAVIATGSLTHDVTGSYNHFYNNTNNISGTVSLSQTLTNDPLFVDTSTNNYNLLVISPCVNSGNPDPFFNDNDGSRNDRGALPFDSLQSFSFHLLFPPNILQEIVYDMKPVFLWSSSIDADLTDTVSYTLYLDTSFSLTNALTISQIEDTSIVLSDSLLFTTRYFWKVTASDQNGFENETAINEFWTWTLGDVNKDHLLDIADLVYYVDYSFAGGAPITPLKLGDLTGDCTLDIADIVRFVQFMFGGTGTLVDIGCE